MTLFALFSWNSHVFIYFLTLFDSFWLFLSLFLDYFDEALFEFNGALVISKIPILNNSNLIYYLSTLIKSQENIKHEKIYFSIVYYLFFM